MKFKYGEPLGSTELQHHGIKGMKWGVRRTKKQLGKATYSVNKPKNNTVEMEDPFKVKPNYSNPSRKNRKPVSEMTNKELDDFIKRATLEKRYSELTKNDVSRGRRIARSASDIIIKSATDVAKQQLTAATTALITKALLGDEKKKKKK